MQKKRGSEMLTTIIAIAIVGTLVISVMSMFMDTIKANNEGLIKDVEQRPVLINKGVMNEYEFNGKMG